MKNFLPNFQKSVVELSKKFPLQIVIFGQTLLIVVLIVLVPLIFITLRKDKNNNSKASTPAGTATIALSPATSTLTPNTQQTVDVVVNTGVEKVDGIQAIVNFSGTVPSNISFSPATVAGLTPIVNLIEPAGSGKKLSLAFITNNPLQPFTTSSSLVKIGTLSFTTPASGNMTTTFDTTLTTAIKNGTSEDILKTPQNSTYTFAIPSPTATSDLPSASGASLSFTTLTPPNPQIVGSTFEVSIVANTATQRVSGVDAQITFDPRLVEIVSVQKPAGTLFPSYPELNFDNTTGKIFVAANIGTALSATPVTGSSIQVAKIVGKTKAPTSSTTLQFSFTPDDRNDSNIVLYLDQQGQEPVDILTRVSGQELIAVNPATPTPGPTNTPGPTKTPTPTLTLTPSATPSPTVTPTRPKPRKIKIALQGKGRSDVDKTIEVSVNARGLLSNATQTYTITTTSVGEITLDLLPDNYIFVVKAPGYLAKKIGTTTNPVVITDITTSVDLSSTSMLGGDFNNDGEVNEIDYTLNFLTSFRNSNPVVDLDGSGNVNNIDFSIMRSNWALKSESL